MSRLLTVVDLRHPLRDERNRGHATGAGERRHARAVAAEPGLDA